MLSQLRERKEQLGYGLEESTPDDLVHINEQIDELAQVHALASDRWLALSEQGQLMAQTIAGALNCPEIPLGDDWPHRPDQAHREFERLSLSVAEDAEAEDLTDALWAEAGRQAEEDPTLSGAALGKVHHDNYVGLVSVACDSFFKASADGKIIDGIRKLADEIELLNQCGLSPTTCEAEAWRSQQLGSQTINAVDAVTELRAVPAAGGDPMTAFVDAMSALSITINTAREELTHLELTASLLAVALDES